MAFQITAENQFSPWDEVRRQFNFVLSGTWVANVTVQKRYLNEQAQIYDVEVFTENVAKVGTEPERRVEYRFGVKTGDFTSGAIIGRISQ